MSQLVDSIESNYDLAEHPILDEVATRLLVLEVASRDLYLALSQCRCGSHAARALEQYEIINEARIVK